VTAAYGPGGWRIAVLGASMAPDGAAAVVESDRRDADPEPAQPPALLPGFRRSALLVIVRTGRWTSLAAEHPYDRLRAQAARWRWPNPGRPYGAIPYALLGAFALWLILQIAPVNDGPESSGVVVMGGRSRQRRSRWRRSASVGLIDASSCCRCDRGTGFVVAT
jgi:hypothetical protein